MNSNRMNSNRDYSLKQRHGALAEKEEPLMALIEELLKARRDYQEAIADPQRKLPGSVRRSRSQNSKAKLQLARKAIGILDKLEGSWKPYTAAKKEFEKEFRDVHPPNAAHRFVSWGS